MKKRLDLILFEKGFFETKNAASSAILAGNVKIDDTPVTKAGQLFDEEKLFNKEKPHKIEIKTLPYVSRGGLKLKGAIDYFKINLKDKVCIDMGSSTGGFCDCMLQEGAKKVFAVDCGTNQLAWKLRCDKRIVSKENVNIKTCKFEDIFGENYSGELPEFLSMDLSFISIKKVLENCKNFICENAQLVILIKPQFEAQREEIAKGGIVKDKKVHEKIINDIKEFCSNLNLETQGIIESPIKGAKQGNTEYLIYLKRKENQ